MAVVLRRGELVSLAEECSISGLNHDWRYRIAKTEIIEGVQTIYLHGDGRALRGWKFRRCHKLNHPITKRV